MTKSRFTGGPLYWRKRSRGIVIDVAPEVHEVTVPGLLRPMKYEFRSIKDFEEDVRKGALHYREGVYRRVEPDRFRWVGWRNPTPSKKSEAVG